MASVCFYFQVHQPFRLRRYSVFDTDRHYFDDHKNAEITRKVAHKCYLPANRTLLETIRAHDGRFRIAYSITGSALEQFQLFAPEVLESFHQLNQTGCVEFLDETYFHSLSFLYSREEFRTQVEQHRQFIKQLFGQEPRVFRNTELIYNNDLAHFVSHMGYEAILTEGADHILGFRSPNYVYRPPHAPKLKLLLKNYRLSDDIAFRFSNRDWEQYPLTAEKFAGWVNQINGNGFLCNLFMDYETFGEQQWAETGIFDFMRHLPDKILEHSDNNFLTPSQVIDKYDAVGEIDVPHMISWADSERDLSAWLGNAMQSNALHEMYKLEGPLKEKGDEQLLTDWRKVTTSDHFYYMCTKYWSDGAVQKYFSPYESPYDSYINFMNVLDNIQTRLRPDMSEPPLVIRQGVSGRGVFAQRPIARGQLLLEFTGPLLRYSQTTPQTLALQIGPDLYLGASNGLDDCVNHSCRPNSGLLVRGTDVRLIAIDDIVAGEEICFDYSTTMDEDDFEMTCHCGQPECRGRIRDFKHLPQELKRHYADLGIVPEYNLRYLDGLQSSAVAK